VTWLPTDSRLPARLCIPRSFAVFLSPMNSSVTHPAARSDGSWLVRYADALRQLDGARMTECFTCNGSYRSFLVHVQLPPPPASPMRGYSYGRPPPRPPSDPELEGRMSVKQRETAGAGKKKSCVSHNAHL
jgi:hypothetical protein